METVEGIGGVCFRAKDPESLARWYSEHPGVDNGLEGASVRHQEAGPTILAPFSGDTEYFGRREQQFTVNSRVRGIDAEGLSRQERGWLVANGFNPAGIWGPEGKAFSQGVVQHEGRVVHVTGQVAWDADHRIVGEGDVGAQLEKCFENVGAVLGEVGGVLDDVVSQTIYYTDDAQLPRIQEVRSRHFSVPTAPVSILIRAAGLVDPGLLVEVVPVAVVPHERFREPGRPVSLESPSKRNR